MDPRTVLREYFTDPTDPTLASVGRDIFNALHGRLLTPRTSSFAAIFARDAKIRTRAVNAIEEAGVHKQEARSQSGHLAAEAAKRVNKLEQIQREHGIRPNRGPVRQSDPDFLERMRKLKEAVKKRDHERAQREKKPRPPKTGPPRTGH